MQTTQLTWPSQTPTNIIVRMPNWIGDAVMATPILTDLKNHWKDAKLTAMCQHPIGTLLQHNPYVDAIYDFSRPSGWIHRLHRMDIVESLQEGKYDLGLLLTNSFSSAWWFVRGNVQNRIGFANGMRNLLLDQAIPFPKNKETQHQVITYKALLEPLGISLSDTPPKLYVSDREKEDAHQYLKLLGIDLKKNIVVGINPGAAYGSAKCWPPERFEGITCKLIENPDVYVLYFGDSLGAPLVNDICKNFSERVINLAGRTTLRELIALIQCCSIFLTNDSGPMHIAAALGIRLVALFGSTNEVKTGPYPEGKVIHKHVECSPCYKRVCPIDFRCMKRIQVDEVYDELIKMLPRQRAEGPLHTR
jgi:heptosyltransferase II